MPPPPQPPAPQVPAAPPFDFGNLAQTYANSQDGQSPFPQEFLSLLSGINSATEHELDNLPRPPPLAAAFAPQQLPPQHQPANPQFAHQQPPVHASQPQAQRLPPPPQVTVTEAAEPASGGRRKGCSRAPQQTPAASFASGLPPRVDPITLPPIASFDIMPAAPGPITITDLSTTLSSRQKSKRPAHGEVNPDFMDQHPHRRGPA